MIQDGNNTFKEVYTSVANVIKQQDAPGMQLYSEAVDKLDKVIQGVASKKKAAAAAAKPTQRKAVTNDAVQLLADAVLAKEMFETSVDDLVTTAKAAGYSVRVEIGDIKNVDRVIQKGLFVSLRGLGLKKEVPPDVSGVLDVVRAMITCDTMDDAAGIIETLLQMAKDGKLVVVRLKERTLET